MEKVICINDQFSPDWLSWALENNIKHPIEGKVYTIRAIKKHSNGKKGVLLDEIHNPEVDQMGGFFKLEPTFDLSRFTTLLGEPIKEELENEVLL